MELLVWIGATVAGLGLLGVLGCAFGALGAKRSAPDEAALKAKLQRLVILNMVAFGVACLGLMTLAIGLILS